MSTKRAYSAYLSNEPANVPFYVHGFGASQLQQAHQEAPSSISRIRPPGAWPGDFSFSDEEDQVAPARSSTIFTTIGKWVATTAIVNMCALPARLLGRFFRQQTIKAVPVVSSSGGNKRRFIAAGVADDVATPSPSVRAHENQSRRRSLEHNQTHASSEAPQLWRRLFSPQQSNASSHATIPFTSPLATAPDFEGLQTPPKSVFGDDEEFDEDVDMSIDFSFDDILTSTPPRNPQTGSPVHVSWNSPCHLSPTVKNESVGTSTAPKPLLSSNGLQVPTARTTEPVGVQPRSQRFGRRSILKTSTATPLRRQLVKRQLAEKFSLLAGQRQANADAQVDSPAKGSAEAEPEPVNTSPTDAMDCDHYISHASTSPPHINTNPESVVNSSVPDFEYTNDLSFLSDAPTPSPRKGVKWAVYAGAKRFYYDERVSEMLDSTLETIGSSPARGVWRNFPANNQITDDSYAPSSGESSATNSPQTTSQRGPDSNSGFHGVPDDTFDASDDSLEESQISFELLEDLQNEMQKKLALAPPPPPSPSPPSPPPPPKPLVTPLSPEETAILEAAAADTSNGLKSDKWVIDEKLYARDFGTLLPRLFNGSPKAWLNDSIVNEYLSIIVAAKKKEAGFEHKRGGPAPPVHAFSSFWYAAADTTRWSGRAQLKGKQYLDAQLILYPICDNGHWRLLAVYPKDRSIEYLDSLGLDGQKYIDKLMAYLEKELGDLFIPSEWNKDTVQRSRQQMNGSDCGVFTLLNALALLRGDDTNLVLPTDGMDDARRRIAATLLAGRPTTEFG
ncbi:C-terminal catalytic domain containing protein [Pyrenophora tritici-repentis]|uniref:C-terminal catalytic domain containing protein n=3 Tax=Pyrenophora tritici-repentis TaxID=45151 RepID=A0A922SRA4_9PLEO|nr:sentrin 17 [Pyrenophora tritici-repentis Pt-1C-BFP]EDU42074.1 sentrin 17 [Pyrenophora tritici-repentis Pt-1C-BFP]KAI1513131.1 C-terminal catalytic domain containing protein [Pyrenophora tritici-repentis]KAI1664977.1 C-terminal catalytic domain containing protein [Pyrenophora tritici-repentis]KAI1690088.1 C-terminal catalytic domain containing protein [Pyrenophora tritici-repentis]